MSDYPKHELAGDDPKHGLPNQKPAHIDVQINANNPLCQLAWCSRVLHLTERKLTSRRRKLQQWRNMCQRVAMKSCNSQQAMACSQDSRRHKSTKQQQPYNLWDECKVEVSDDDTMINPWVYPLLYIRLSNRR